MTEQNQEPLAVPDQASERIVSFYLIQETDLPAKFQGDRQIGMIDVVASSGETVKKLALRVTFSCKQSLEKLIGLVAFGSDDRCHVLLPAHVASSLHCRIYAQLNSGPGVWLIDDNSTHGTQVEDDDTARNKLTKTVHGRRQAAVGLRTIRIGHYSFGILTSVSEVEAQRREHWFRINKPIPVTRSMFDRQLEGRGYDWLRLDLIGSGGFGQVFRCMERHTALYVAIKMQKLAKPGKENQAKKEVTLMQTLRHVYLVDFLFSESKREGLELFRYTAMPLYLGDLWDLLSKSPDIRTKERIIVQVFEGVHYMHKNRVLHRDLKPENIFWVTESPATVKVGDYGLATSLADHLELIEPCGTAAYMAPEVFQRKTQTAAIDVFSLGATVFAILEYKLVKKGWYKKGRDVYNHVFDDVSRSPPHQYAGLVQSMMAPNPGDRPSLDLCIEVVKGKRYNWTKKAPVLNITPIAPTQVSAQGPARAMEPPPSPLDRAMAFAAKRDRIVPNMQPGQRQTAQQALVTHEETHQQRPRILQGSQAPTQPAVTVEAPKPAPIRGVNFEDGLPSYEEATRNNPFAKLLDSREVTQRRCRSKLNPRQTEAGPIVEQHAKPTARHSRNPKRQQPLIDHISPTNPIQPTAQPYVSASSRSRRSASDSTSMTRSRAHQTARRPRHERAQALDIRRTGTGRIRKGTLTGIKAGALDMGKGLWQFSRGLGLATYNISYLTAQGFLMLYDLAARRHSSSHDQAPRIPRLRLNPEEVRLVVSMRADSLRREGERPDKERRDRERRARFAEYGDARPAIEDRRGGGRRHLGMITEVDGA